MNLPQEFLARMEALLGDDYPAFLQSYEEPRRYGLRVNTLKISVDEFQRIAPFHLTPIPWIDNGFFYEEEDAVSRHPFYYAGLYYLQEPSAMTPAQLLPVSPGERVLDLCAAPGGKATALAAKLQGQGLLVANDISAARAKALLKNLELFGVTNALVTNTTPNVLSAHFPESFDKILVDAPCSGEGMFRKDAASAAAWSLKKVNDCARTQKEIVSYAVSMLRPGGMMLYSTCTFSPEEDEQVIAYLLENHPEMELVEIPMAEGFVHGLGDVLSGDWQRRGHQATENQTPDLSLKENSSGRNRVPELSRCVRIFPHKMPGEGHFMALLRKNSKAEHNANLPEYRTEIRHRQAESPDSVIRKSSGKKPKQKVTAKEDHTERQTAESFLQDILLSDDREPLDIRGSQAYAVPDAIRALNITGGIPFLRCGLYLGEIRKERFEPSQALAMSLRTGDCDPAAVLNLNYTDDRVRRYLCGETIEVDDLCEDDSLKTRKGWCLVCVNGFPLGWGALCQWDSEEQIPSRLEDEVKVISIFAPHRPACCCHLSDAAC